MALRSKGQGHRVIKCAAGVDMSIVSIVKFYFGMHQLPFAIITVADYNVPPCAAIETRGKLRHSPAVGMNS